MVKQGIWKEELWLKSGVKLEVEFYVLISECDCGVVNEVEQSTRTWEMKIFVTERPEHWINIHVGLLRT